MCGPAEGNPLAPGSFIHSPCHPVLQTQVLASQRPLSGYPHSDGQHGTSHAWPFQLASHSQYTDSVEFPTRHSPRPEQLLGHVFTLEEKKQRGRETQTLAEISRHMLSHISSRPPRTKRRLLVRGSHGVLWSLFTHSSYNNNTSLY